MKKDKLRLRLESEALMYGYDSGLRFEYKNPYPDGTPYWEFYMAGYILGCKDIQYVSA